MMTCGANYTNLRLKCDHFLTSDTHETFDLILVFLFVSSYLHRILFRTLNHQYDYTFDWTMLKQKSMAANRDKAVTGPGGAGGPGGNGGGPPGGPGGNGGGPPGGNGGDGTGRPGGDDPHDKDKNAPGAQGSEQTLNQIHTMT